jgi:hypothetical protein
MEMRRHERVVHRAKMRLRRSDQDEGLVVRVENLSLLGVFVTGEPSSELPEPGTMVRCGFLFAGEPRTIQGRVVWRRPAPPPPGREGAGVGIEFLKVAERDAAVLRHIIERQTPEAHAVDIWFQGTGTATRCQASVAGRELELATRLPFMRLYSPVRFAFADEPANEGRRGTIESVSLAPIGQDGAPELHIGLFLTPAEEAAGRSDEQPSLPAVAPGTGAEPEPARALADAAPADSPAGPSRALPLPSSAFRQWWRWPSQGWRPALLGGVGGALLAGLVLAGGRSSGDLAVGRGLELEMRSLGGKQQLRIPLSGSSAGAQQRPLADRPGISVVLPLGVLRLPPGVHRAGNGLEVKVHQRGSGTEVQFLYDPRIHNAEVVVESGGVMVELTPKP